MRVLSAHDLAFCCLGKLGGILCRDLMEATLGAYILYIHIASGQQWVYTTSLPTLVVTQLSKAPERQTCLIMQQHRKGNYGRVGQLFLSGGRTVMEIPNWLCKHCCPGAICVYTVCKAFYYAAGNEEIPTNKMATVIEPDPLLRSILAGEEGQSMAASSEKYTRLFLLFFFSLATMSKLKKKQKDMCNT